MKKAAFPIDLSMLTELENQGYEVVPISELIMRDNYHMDVMGKQIADE